MGKPDGHNPYSELEEVRRRIQEARDREKVVAQEARDQVRTITDPTYDRTATAAARVASEDWPTRAEEQRVEQRRNWQAQRHPMPGDGTETVSAPVRPGASPERRDHNETSHVRAEQKSDRELVQERLGRFSVKTATLPGKSRGHDDLDDQGY